MIGTRLQARCFLSRQHPEQIEFARKDSDRAIEEFVDESES